MRLRIWPIGLATALASLAIPAGALGAVGDLTPAGCIDDTSAGADVCSQDIDTFDISTDGAPGVALSPDGTSVYVAVNGADAISRFSRNTATGALTPQGCIEDNDTGPGECAQTTDGLRGAISVVVSPDGTSVYAASIQDSAVTRFDRNTSTGALTPQGCVEDNDTGPDACAQGTDGLNGTISLAISPDGTSLYAAGATDDAIARFDRNLGTGSIAAQGCVHDNDTGTDACTGLADGLDNPRWIEMAPDGTSVYAASAGDEAIARFDRVAGGALVAQGCVEDNDVGPDACALSADGLDTPVSVTVSPDGASVYSTSIDDDAVARFDRNGAGALTAQGCIDDNDTGPDACASTIDGLSDSHDVIVSPDGASAYVAGTGDDAIALFSRGSNGSLTPTGCLDDDDSGPETCAQTADALDAVSGFALGADAASLYALSGNDSAIVRFGREVADADADGIADFLDDCPSQAGPASNNGCPVPGGGGGGGGGAATDTAPPDTTITGGPKKKEKKGNASFTFTSSEAGSSFQCSLDGGPFQSCSSPEDVKVKKGKHTFEVRATDAAGNTDPTPATQDWTVKKKKKK